MSDGPYKNWFTVDTHFVEDTRDGFDTQFDTENDAVEAKKLANAAYAAGAASRDGGVERLCGLLRQANEHLRGYSIDAGLSIAIEAALENK